MSETKELINPMGQAPGQIPVSLEDEMQRSYLDYAMSVIVSRAIPDVRDGLKPVHRRIIFSMNESGFYADKPPRKSARIVGDVIGKYHPHGDSAVYDSLVRLAQDFSLRVPLVNGQGNFGSIDGDAAASMRYTESRMAKVTHYLVDDLDKDTVNFQDNYDASEREPNVLPSKFPNLLVNGSGGIAVGMATNIPPHNLGEVIDAACAYVDNKDIQLAELITHVKGPDFPTAGIILGQRGINSAYLTGRGSIMYRGRAEVEEQKNGRQRIIISEIPYMVNKARLVEKIAELVQEKRIEGISDLRDESNKDGIRVVIELKKGFVGDVILNQLYSYTQLQTSFGVNMLALDGGVPKVMNLKEVIGAFVDFREEVITRRTIFLLNKARAKAHILLGLMLAVNNIDEVIRIIKASSSPQIAKDELISRKWPCGEILPLVQLVDDDASNLDGGDIYLTETQAKAILDMKLSRLTAMEKDKIKADMQALADEISEYINILNSKERLFSILKEEMLLVKEKFATPRLTEISNQDYECDIEELIQREEMVVTVTHGGYIKRVPLDTYRLQKRGGRGRLAMSTRDEDITKELFVGITHTPLLFFSNLGQVYSLKLYKLPLGTPQSKGRPLINLLPLRDGEQITNVMPMPEDEKDWQDMQILFATKRGNIRRNDLSDFNRIQSNGKIAIRLADDDQLVNVHICGANDFMLLASKEGKAVYSPVEAVRIFRGRTSDGVRGMRLVDGDHVISMSVVGSESCSPQERELFLSLPLDVRSQIATGEITDIEQLRAVNAAELPDLEWEKLQSMALKEEFIMTISEKGYGKLTSCYEYRITDRGGKGIVNMNLSEKTGKVVATFPIKRDNELMLMTNLGQVIRFSLSTIRVTGRATSGVILFKTQGDERVVSASIVEEAGNEDDSIEESTKG